MSATLNQVTLIGNLARDPEVGQTAGGATMCRMRLAVNETFRDRRTGEERTIATFLDVVAWGPVAENCGRFLGGSWEEPNAERTERAVPKGQTFHGHREQRTERPRSGRRAGPP